jgi:hypothetical protein
MICLSHYVSQQQHAQLPVTQPFAVSVRLTHFLVNPFGNLHLLEPFHDYRNIVNSLRTNFRYWGTHKLKAPFVALQTTSMTLARYPLARLLYPLSGMPLIPLHHSKSSNRHDLEGYFSQHQIVGNTNLLLAMARNNRLWSQLSEPYQLQGFLPLIYANRYLEDYEGRKIGQAFFLSRH